MKKKTFQVTHAIGDMCLHIQFISHTEKFFVFPNSNKSPKILNPLTVNLNQISELYLFHVLPDNLLEFTLFLTNLYISNLAIKSPIFKKFQFPKAML